MGKGGKGVDSIGWLADLALGFLATDDPEQAEFMASLQPFRTLSVSAGTFKLFLNSKGEPLAKSATFNIYICAMPGDKRLGVAKVSTNVDADGNPLPEGQIRANASLLRKEAELLRFMREKSLELDGLLPEPLFHHSFFPEVVHSFGTKDGVYITMLGYPRDVKTLAQLPAISKLMGKPGNMQRIDLKTAWVYGKLLKCLHFAHSLGITNGLVTSANVLVSPDEHAVILFDWRKAQQTPGWRDEKAERLEVIKAAEVFVRFAGGNWDGTTLTLPYDSHDLQGHFLMTEEAHRRCVTHFTRILSGDCGSAYQEHDRWYSLTDQTWPPQLNSRGELKRQFHQFQLYPVL